MDKPYTVFIGREVAERGVECFVTIESREQELTFAAYTNLQDACLDLDTAVREGKRVILTQTPDFLPTPSVPCHPTTEYHTLTAGQFYELQQMYKMIHGIEKYPDPFADQPSR